MLDVAVLHVDILPAAGAGAKASSQADKGGPCRPAALLQVPAVSALCQGNKHTADSIFAAGANGEQPPAKKRVVYTSKKKQAQPSKREDPTEATAEAEEASPQEQQGAEAQAEAASSTAAAQEQAEAAKAAAQEELAATAEVMVVYCSVSYLLRLSCCPSSGCWCAALTL